MTNPTNSEDVKAAVHPDTIRDAVHVSLKSLAEAKNKPSVEVWTHDLRTILAALTAAEQARDEALRGESDAMAHVRGWKAKHDQAVKERDEARGVIDAARAYFDGWMQDEAADDGPWITGCSQEQHEAAKALGDALAIINPAKEG